MGGRVASVTSRPLPGEPCGGGSRAHVTSRPFQGLRRRGRAVRWELWWGGGGESLPTSPVRGEPSCFPVESRASPRRNILPVRGQLPWGGSPLAPQAPGRPPPQPALWGCHLWWQQEGPPRILPALWGSPLGPSGHRRAPFSPALWGSPVGHPSLRKATPYPQPAGLLLALRPLSVEPLQPGAVYLEVCRAFVCPLHCPPSLATALWPGSLEGPPP